MAKSLLEAVIDRCFAVETVECHIVQHTGEEQIKTIKHTRNNTLQEQLNALNVM